MAIWDNSFNKLKTKMFSMCAPFTSFVKESNDLLVIWPQICQMHVLPTFINVYCGWLSTKDIDFRQHIDLYCLHNVEMLDCDGTRHGPPMTYASLIKPSEVSNSAEIRSNIKIDENYLKGYHWYASSFMNNRMGTSQAHEARQSLCFICHQALPSLKATDVLSTEVDSQKLSLLHQVSENCAVFTGHFQQWYVWKNNILAVTHSFLVLCANIALMNLTPFDLHKERCNNVENKLQVMILVMFCCHYRKCVFLRYLYFCCMSLIQIPDISWHGH